MKAVFTFLGTGASTGVPMIGCKCSTCLSKNTKNKRLRPAGLIQYDNKKILIDAGPDIRQQLLREEVDHLDGLMLSHSHYDHIGGLDELRVFFFKRQKPLDCLLSQATKTEVQKRYHYMFMEQNANSSYTARFAFSLLEQSKKVEFLGLQIQPVYYFQGDIEVTGFIIGDLAYLCDLKNYQLDLFEQLQGINTLVVSALKMEPSAMHLNLEEAMQFAQKVGARNTYFTHVAHELEHDEGNKVLPPGMALAFDGLHFTFNTSCVK